MVTLHLPDMDGDKKKEQLVYTECGLCETAEVSIELSQTGQKERVRLPFPVSRLFEGSVEDFDGDGRKEILVLLAKRDGKLALLRLWRERRNWQYEVMPARIAKSYYESNEEIVRIGDRDWIFLFSSYTYPEDSCKQFTEPLKGGGKRIGNLRDTSAVCGKIVME
ncbi:MAG: hypothetical protein ACUVTP_04580 [Candidatus Fervidibacter sp.]|uniref:hypothetical protein n=1 Tax=Candidatus Fervidibacter sp. TaxID=3100871 RepID=UPI0040499067